MLVAGFQGVSTDSRDVTTLGRGGSDTTAVALAAALGAEVCEIYTDVAGVFSADPRIVPDARKLHVVSFEEMLEMAASGAGVLQLRSVEYARNHGVRIHCRSCFEDGPGTFVVAEEETMEQPLITAVTHSTDEARVTLIGVPDEPGVAGAHLRRALADANVNVDMIIQNEPVGDGAAPSISFTVPRDDLRDRARRARAARRRGSAIEVDDRRGDGQGLDRRRRHALAPGRRREGLRVLGDERLNIEMISTSPIKISCVIDRDRVAARCGRCTAPSSSAPTRSRPRTPTGPRHPPPRRSLIPNRSCRRRSGAGAHQFHLPSSSISEGTSRARMMLASISTASAVPTPFSLMKMICEVAKAPIATANSSAAAVTIRPVRSSPIATHSESEAPLSRASLIRESRKTA